MKYLLSLLTASLFLVALSGCPSECAEGDYQCDGEQIQTCVDGEWSDPEDCEDAAEACMTMDDGTTHCMGSM